MTRKKFIKLIRKENMKYLQMTWKDVNKLLDKIVFPKDNNNCYNWGGAVVEYGYGKFTFQLKGEWEEKLSNGRKKEKTVLVHRVLKILIEGSPPKDKPIVCHKKLPKKYRTKDKIRCVCPNPLHSKWGTHSKNTRQMHKDGTAPKHKGNGEDNSMSELKEHQVVDIYKRAWYGEPHKNIAKDYPIHVSSISRIKVGTDWSWLTENIQL